MIAPFDIFKVDGEGLLWRGTAHTLDDAKALVQSLLNSDPGDYMILSQRTGNKLHFKAEGSPRKAQNS